MREEEIERIVHSYSTMLLRFSMHHVKEEAQAQDIVQNVFMKYMEKQPVFIDEEHEKAWLLRVASNMCKDYLGPVSYTHLDVYKRQMSGLGWEYWYFPV